MQRPDKMRRTIPEKRAGKAGGVAGRGAAASAGVPGGHSAADCREDWRKRDQREHQDDPSRFASRRIMNRGSSRRVQFRTNIPQGLHFAFSCATMNRNSPHFADTERGSVKMTAMKKRIGA